MKRWVYIAIIIVFAAAAALAGFKLFSGLWTYKRGNDLYNDIKSRAVSEQSTEQTKTTEVQTTEVQTTEDDGIDYSVYETEGKLRHLHADIDYMIWPRYEVDFEMLKDLTEDIRGWIRIEDTHIDYPVVQHTDNSFYIRHGIDGEQLNTGSIFIDFREKNPFQKENTIIYGHNQRNSAMFHDLVLYTDQTFADEHPYVIIYLPDGTEQTYRVFSAYQTSADSNTYSMFFSSEESYYSYLMEMQTRSETDFLVSVTQEDTIITLSTCTNEADNMRMVVQAKLISTR